MMNLNRFILFLKSFKGIGDASIRRLIVDGCFEGLKLGNHEDFLRWLKKHKYYFKNPKSIDELTILDVEMANATRKETEKKLEDAGAKYISWFDDSYPRRYKNMKETNDFPVLLFYKGNIDLMNSEKVCAIIGTRHPSNEAITLGNQITHKMVEEGYVVISGLAIGCDKIGHESCLAAGGKTIAILGNGIDSVYPKENKDLAQRILDSAGLILTEEFPGAPAARYSLVNRDRLQAAGADVVIALESSINGGTMHAAKATTTKYHHKLVVIEPELIPNADSSGNVELINKYGAIRYKSYEGLYKILNPTKGSNGIIRYFVSNAGLFVDKLIKLCNDEAYVFDNGEWKFSIQYKELLDDTTKYVEISPEVAKQYIKDYKN